MKKSLKNFLRKKIGRPLKIGEELDKQVVTYMRSIGTTANTSVAISCAEGILMHKNASMLSRVDLNKGWAQYLLQKQLQKLKSLWKTLLN